MVAIILLYIAGLTLMPLDAERFEWSEVPRELESHRRVGVFREIRRTKT